MSENRTDSAHFLGIAMARAAGKPIYMLRCSTGTTLDCEADLRNLVRNFSQRGKPKGAEVYEQHLGILRRLKNVQAY